MTYIQLYFITPVPIKATSATTATTATTAKIVEGAGFFMQHVIFYY